MAHYATYGKNRNGIVSRLGSYTAIITARAMADDAIQSGWALEAWVVTDGADDPIEKYRVKA